MDYRSMFDRKYIGAWDLKGKDVTLKIAKVAAEELRNRSGANKKPVVYFVGTQLGFALNKTNAKTIAAMYGTDTAQWVGKAITIYPSKTSFGSNEVDAVRVRPTVPGTDKKPEAIEAGPVDEAVRAEQEKAVDEAGNAN